jgi:hypothetical protein
LNEVISTEGIYRIFLEDQIKEDEMDGACRMHVRDEKYIQNYRKKV